MQKEIIKNQNGLINTQEERIALLKENSDLVNTRLEQCEEIMEQQYQAITHCHKYKRKQKQVIENPVCKESLHTEQSVIRKILKVNIPDISQE